jgi:PAS domain S-box-containing protein
MTTQRKSNENRYVARFAVLYVGGDGKTISRLLRGDGSRETAPDVFLASGVEEARRILTKHHVDVVLADDDALTPSVEESLELLRRAHPAPPMVLLVSNEPEWLEDPTLRQGVEDWLSRKHLSSGQLYWTLCKAIEHSCLHKTFKEQALQFQELYLQNQAILRGTPHGLCMLGPDWLVRRINAGMQVMLHADDESTQTLVGTPFGSFFCSPEDFEAFQQSVSKALGMEGTDIRKVEMRRLDGELFHAELSTVRLDPSQTAPGYVVTVVDETPRFHMLDQLRMISRIVEQTVDGVSVTDPRGLIEYVNPAFTAMTGHAAAEAIGNDAEMLLHSEYIESDASDIIRTAVQAGKPWRTLCRNQKKCGAWYYEDLTITPMLDDRGQVAHIIRIGRDVTREKEAEETLRRSHQRFVRVFHAIPMPAGITRLRDGTFLDINDSFLEMTGYSREEVIGHTSVELRLWSSAREREDYIARLREKGVLRGVPFKLRTRAGRIRETLATTDTIDVGGEVCVLHILQDVTDLIRANQALRKSEERFRGIVESQLEYISRLDLKGRFTYANNALCKALGKTSEELLGAAFVSHVFPEDIPLVTSEIKDLENPPHRGHSTHRVLTTSGVRWIHFEGCAIRDEVGNYTEIQSVGRDVTEEREAKEKLQRSENRFARLFRNSAIPTSLSRMSDNTLVDVNQAFVDLIKIPREQVLGNTAVDLGLWVNPAQRQAIIETLRRDKKLDGRPVTFRDGRGEIHEGLASADLLEIEGEAMMLFMVQDVTELRRAEREMAEATAQLTATVCSIPDTLFVLDRDGRFLKCHAAEDETHGHRPKSLLGRTCSEMFPPDVAEQYNTAIRRVLDTREIQSIIYKINSGGSVLHYEARLVICGDEHCLASARDITKAVQLRDGLLAAERLAAVGRTAEIAAHGIRNIFTTLKGASTLLSHSLAAKDYANAEKAAALLEKSSARLYLLFMEMMDYSRRSDPRMRRIELRPLLEEVADMLRVAARPDTTISVEIAPDAQHGNLDREWMTHVLLNLGQNALDAMPKGGALDISAAVSRAFPVGTDGQPPRTDADQWLILEVRDTGTGISPAHLSSLFDPLFTTKAAKGTGLGLPCVKQFVEGQGGTIQLETTENIGSTFRLVFPCLPETPAEPSSPVS